MLDKIIHFWIQMITVAILLAAVVAFLYGLTWVFGPYLGAWIGIGIVGAFVVYMAWDDA